MKKVRVIGVGNEGRYNYIIVRKNKDFFKWLAELLGSNFGVDDVENYGYEQDKRGRWINRKKNINHFVDKHEGRYEGYSGHKDNSRIDVFYGKNDVFIVIDMSLQKRKKFMKKLNEISIWIKPKKPKNTKIIKK